MITLKDEFGHLPSTIGVLSQGYILEGFLFVFYFWEDWDHNIKLHIFGMHRSTHTILEMEE